MTQTNQTTNLPLRVPSGAEIYDALMSEIDTDLLTANLPLLDGKYKGETPEERALRYERYRKAYESYDKAFEQWLAALKTAVDTCRRDALHSAEGQSREQEGEELLQLESQFGATA